MDDRKLVERVRAELGKVASHPRAVHAAADRGRVRLSGDAFDGEVHAIVAAIRGVRGVEEVDNELTVHAVADGVPALQGSSSRTGRWSAWLPGNWSPTVRLLAGAGAALSLTVVAIRQR